MSRINHLNHFSDLWDLICEMLKENMYITEVGFNMWLSESYIIDYKEKTLYISVPTEQHKKIIINTYDDKLKLCASNIFGANIDFEFVVNQNENRGIPDKMQDDTKLNTFAIGNEFTFNNFVLGPSNRYAQAAAMAVAENPAKFYNPLLIYGASGVGKTHLMFAIRNRIAEIYPEKKIEIITCEEFTSLFIESTRAGTVSLFHNRFRSADVLLIDDIQFIEKKEVTQEELFNTIDTLLKAKKQVVLTSDRPPKDINSLDDRLRSRFESGLLADIASPELETRIGIIKIKTEDKGITLEEDLVYYIADQLKSNIRQIEGMINQINAYINLHSTNPTMPVVQNYIRNIVSDSRPDPINVDRIISEVSHVLKISDADIRSKKRMAEIVWARHVAIYVTSRVTNISNMQISKEFKMDHASIGHALKKVEDRISTDNFEKRRITEIIDNIKRIQ